MAMYKLTRRNVEIKLCYDHLTKTRGHRSMWAVTLLNHIYFFDDQNYIYTLCGTVTPDQIGSFKPEEATYNYHAILGNKYEKLMDRLCGQDREQEETSQPTLFK